MVEYNVAAQIGNLVSMLLSSVEKKKNITFFYYYRVLIGVSRIKIYNPPIGGWRGSFY